jgi:hypothetical protein
MPENQPERRSARSRRLVAVAASTAVIVLALGLAVFQPWKLVVDEVVDEAAPSAGSAPPAGGAPASSAAATSSDASTPGSSAASSTPSPAVSRVIARGELISHEHTTSGTVVVLALPDGRRVLRLQDLRTSNGPDVKVWLSDAPVLPGADGWRVFDDGAYADLGSLKGNVGNQNYPIPASVDLAALPSLSLWCDRFDVSFGAAVLRPV